ncbi:MAG: acyl-CoA dehydrogenase family protein, partial [Deltaproteobacteria bacterium]|nr:acyl-CoA dehydrogenase family protein [Deltaproteobacteria bacterium]
MNTLYITEKKLSHAIKTLSQESKPNEATLFLLAKMACQLEASRALILVPAIQDQDFNQLIVRLKNLQITSTLNIICGKLAESSRNFGFKNAMEVYNPIADDLDLKDWPNLTLEETTSLGQTLAQFGCVPDYPLDENHKLIRETFRKFANIHVAPIAEKIHREDLLVSNELIMKLSELGCFGLSIPESYGGFQSELDPDYLGMILVTEELSRGSLGAAGSLITRPEILARALLKGGTETQKKYWLPKIASGETMVSIAVTEPDFGSDVANIKVFATQTEKKGEKGWLI